MKALYLSDISKRDAEITMLTQLGLKLDGEDVRIFTLNSSLTSFPYSPNYVGSIFYPDFSELFEQVIIGSSVRLFVNSWAKTLLKHLNDSLQNHGTIVVPFFNNKEATAKGYWSLTALESLFGSKGRIVKNSSYVEFHHNQNLSLSSRSILYWYFCDYAKLIISHFNFKNSILKLSDRDLQQIGNKILLKSSILVKSEQPAVAEIEIDREFTHNLLGILSEQSYFVGGINYKSALMDYIINKYFANKRQLRFIDHGGGYGLLTTELLLNDRLNISKGVNCDINSANIMLAHRLFSHFREKLEGRFFFNLGKSEEFEYDESYDIISFIGSLLYIPREKTLRTLKRAWDALQPGGILVIHENIKALSYTQDYEVMFTVDELEELLSQLGAIDYYLSTATSSVTREQAGVKSVFRVIKKS